MKDTKIKIKNLFKPDNAKKLRTPLLILLLVCLIIAPFITSNLVKRIISTIYIYCLLSMGNMIISGHTGMLNMGHAAFWGTGAYISAILMTAYGMPFWVGFVAAGIGTGIVGLLVSIPCLRLDTDFLSLITTAFQYIFLTIVRNWMSVTRGPMGITAIPCIKLFGIEFSSANSVYYFLLVMAVLSYIILNNIVKSKYGRAMQATRDDEVGARSVGVKTDMVKIMVFIIGTTFAGFAGSLYASYIGYISPNTFVYDISLTFMQMDILGGLGSIPGAIIGAVFFTAMPEIIRPLAVYRVGVGGLIMILFMLFRPQGILGSRAFATDSGIQERIKQWRIARAVRKSNEAERK